MVSSSQTWSCGNSCSGIQFRIHRSQVRSAGTALELISCSLVLEASDYWFFIWPIHELGIIEMASFITDIFQQKFHSENESALATSGALSLDNKYASSSFYRLDQE